MIEQDTRCPCCHVPPLAACEELADLCEKAGYLDPTHHEEQ